MPESPAGFVVADNPAQNQFEGRLDGRLVAHSEYELAPGVITFLHTEVDPALEGQGIGSALASSVLDDVRARGLQVVARCPFIAAYIRRHREYADLLLRTKVGRSEESAGSGGEPAA
jgi:predicted GNAT family acetyltransferase